MWNLQRQGRVSTVAPIVGQEAAVVGVVRALDLAHDWLAPYYRELLGFVALGDDYLESVFAYWRGDPVRRPHPRGCPVLPPQISLGSQVPHAAGIAWALRLRGEPGVVCTFIGDGATSEGDFYEGLNLAGVQKVPLLVAVLNNGWAISTPTSRQTAAPTFAAKAAAAGVPSERVDGNDVLAVLDAGRPRSPACRLGRRAGAARARHLPHGRAHQLRRSQPLRAARGARAVAGARSDRAVPRRAGRARASGRRRPREPRSTTVEARLERIVDTAIGATDPPGRRARPPVRDGECAVRASARGARRTNRCVAVQPRERRRARAGGGVVAVMNMLTAIHDTIARRDGARRPRRSSSARTSAATAACSASPTVSSTGSATHACLRHADLRVRDHRSERGPLRRRASCRSQRSNSRGSARRRTTRSWVRCRGCATAVAAGSTAPSPSACPYGGGVRTPEHHADSVEAPFAHAPGLKIVVPSTAADAKRSARLRRARSRSRARARAHSAVPHGARRGARRRAPRRARYGPRRTGAGRRGGDRLGRDGRRRVRGRRRARASGAARRSASSTSARSHRSTSRRSSASPSAPGAWSWCTRHRSPRGSAPRSSPPSRRRRSGRSRRRSGGSRATTCPRPRRWSRTGVDPTSPRVAAALEAALDA